MIKAVNGKVRKPDVDAKSAQPLVHSIKPAQKARAFCVSLKSKVSMAVKG